MKFVIDYFQIIYHVSFVINAPLAVSTNLLIDIPTLYVVHVFQDLYVYLYIIGKHSTICANNKFTPSHIYKLCYLTYTRS